MFKFYPNQKVICVTPFTGKIEAGKIYTVKNFSDDSLSLNLIEDGEDNNWASARFIKATEESIDKYIQDATKQISEINSAIQKARQAKNKLRPDPACKQIWKNTSRNELYIIANSDSGQYNLICLNDGCRWTAPTGISSIFGGSSYKFEFVANSFDEYCRMQKH